MQIRVTKADGSSEPYLHTKVLGTLHRALAGAEMEWLDAAEMLAEAVTLYLYQQPQPDELTTDGIHQMILSVLCGAGFEGAAEALQAHRLNRRLQRHRVEVLDSDRSGWDKSRIAADLTRRYRIDRLLARTIAGTVEEKILRLGLTHIRRTLIRYLVTADMEALLEADRQLAAAEQECDALWK
ncbi:MAG: hypothetical protein L0Y36_02370 [Planctomycetales bacterium]|nr:hypothetical protein [Planctomycetales bacterium]